LGQSLLPFEVLEYTNKELSTQRYLEGCAATYIGHVKGFIRDVIVQRQIRARSQHGMFDALERDDDWDSDTDLTMGATCMFPVRLIFLILISCTRCRSGCCKQ
jgi:DNA-directed RNA polymerase III subunit RPC1